MNNRRFLFVALLIFSLLLSAIPAGAQDYSALFDSSNWADRSTWGKQLSDPFLSAPVEFVQALTNEKYGQQYNVVSTLVNENDVDYTATITALADDNTLGQAERRIVQWLVGTLRANKGNDIPFNWLREPIDYAEVFSHEDEVDGFAADMFGSELFDVFCQDGNKFIENLAEQEDEVKESLVSSTIYGAYGPCSYIDIIELLDGLDTDTFDSAELELVGQLEAETERMHPSMNPTGTTAPTEEPTVPETSETEPTVPVVTPTPEPKDNSGYLIAAAVVLLLAAAGMVLFIFKKS